MCAFDVTVVGGGIVGLATARALSLGAVFAQVFIVVYVVGEGIAWVRRRGRA